jgi:ATP-dependent DNA ligase
MVLLRECTRPRLGIIEPWLPSPAKAPPSGPGWIHEIKHDGFRILARRNGAGVQLITRAGNDFPSRFPFIGMGAPTHRKPKDLARGAVRRLASENQSQ